MVEFHRKIKFKKSFKYLVVRYLLQYFCFLSAFSVEFISSFYYFFYLILLSMADLDYYSVMHKRIEYYAKKYDPYNRLTVRNDMISEQKPEEKPRRIKQKLAKGYSSVISILF